MNNRIYKFRAWDNANENMVMYPSLVEMFRKYEQEFKRYELMQYTGLKDKNGKEIYEGDIITTSRGLKGIIKWGGRSAKFYISCPRASHDSEKQLTMGNRENVIGNIYENPELLKGDL